MTGNQLARRAKTTVPQSARRLLGPLGVFIGGFLEHPKMVGAVFPSSQATVKAMLERVDWTNCKLFVEYGPGIGTFTRPVLDRLPPGGELLAIDTNPAFVDYLNADIADSRFSAVLGSAEDVEKIVRAARHEAADYVLSGLPISSLPDGVAEEIVAASYRVLAPGGGFLTYQYRAHARRMTQAVFDHVDTGTAFRTFPPNLLTWGWKKA